MPRFSGKELAKEAKINVIIPEGYSDLRLATVEHETEKALHINFIYKESGVGVTIWYPKQYVIQKEGKYYAADWVTNKNLEL